MWMYKNLKYEESVVAAAMHISLSGISCVRMVRHQSSTSTTWGSNLISCFVLMVRHQSSTSTIWGSNLFSCCVRMVGHASYTSTTWVFNLSITQLFSRWNIQHNKLLYLFVIKHLCLDVYISLIYNKGAHPQNNSWRYTTKVSFLEHVWD